MSSLNSLGEWGYIREYYRGYEMGILGVPTIADVKIGVSCIGSYRLSV